jgi:hypothetical protein
MSESNELHPDSYKHISSMHWVGRIGMWGAMAIMVGMPIILGLTYHAMPNALKIITTAASLLAIFIPAAISEIIAFTPILGSSIYLTIVTGEVMNLKIPVVTNAIKVMDIQYGTEEADIVSSIAVSVSALTTMLIVAIGVILMLPLEPVLTTPAVKTAANNILPALFGALMLGIFSKQIGSGAVARGRWKGMVIPALIILGVNLLEKYLFKTGALGLYQGFLIVAMLPLTYSITKSLYQRGTITVALPGEAQD